MSSRKILIGIAILILGILMGLGISNLVERAEDFSKYAEAREAATDKEQFDKNFDNMVKWMDDYKNNNPGSSDEDAQEAFDELWD